MILINQYNKQTFASTYKTLADDDRFHKEPEPNSQSISQYTSLP